MVRVMGAWNLFTVKPKYLSNNFIMAISLKLSKK